MEGKRRHRLQDKQQAVAAVLSVWPPIMPITTAHSPVELRIDGSSAYPAGLTERPAVAGVAAATDAAASNDV